MIRTPRPSDKSNGDCSLRSASGCDSAPVSDSVCRCASPVVRNETVGDHDGNHNDNREIDRDDNRNNDNGSARNLSRSTPQINKLPKSDASLQPISSRSSATGLRGIGKLRWASPLGNLRKLRRVRVGRGSLFRNRTVTAETEQQRQILRKRRQSLKKDAFNLPNLLTMGRIVVIPLVLYLLDRGGPKDCFWATIVFVGAAVTDFLDGYLARKRNLVSVLGKFLDPLADKLIVMSTLIWLVTMGRVPAWLAILLLVREISVTGLRGIASSEGLVIAAGGGGKAKTALQMVGLVCLILGYPYYINFYVVDFGLVDLVLVGRALMYCSLVFSLLSAFQYVRLFVDAVEVKGAGG